MKILESKYHLPERFMVDTYDESIKLRDLPSTTTFPYSTTLSETLVDALRYETNCIIDKSHLKDFVRCTDFITYQYSSHHDKLFEREICYFHPDYEVFIVFNGSAGDKDDKEASKPYHRLDNVFYDSQNQALREKLPEFFAKYIQKYLDEEAKISILVKDCNGLTLRTHQTKPYHIDMNTMYNDDFPAVHEHIKQTLNTTTKGIVLLHGLAGTGKTNYIKWLTSQLPDKNFIFVPTTIIHSLTDPSFIPLLIDNKNSVLVLEDCENYIAERRADNPHTDVVASLLNLADGVLSDVVECQLLCTFNAQIDDVDTALLRQGRLIADYYFDKLSVEKANQYLASVGRNDTVDKPVTLAQLTHLNEPVFKSETAHKHGMGFLSD